MSTLALNPDVAGVSPYVLGVRQTFQEDTGKLITRFPLGELNVELRSSMDSVWAFVRRKGHGGLALRAAYLAGEFSCVELKGKAGEAVRLKIRSALGEHVVSFQVGQDGFEHLRMTVRFKPDVPMLKAGIQVFAETLRKEIAEANIKVTVIQPGSVATSMRGNDFEGLEANRPA